jgi:hypothetical protein
MVRAEKKPHLRDRAFGALLAKESGLGSDRMAIVGGSALEIYTTGDYVSQDIDIIAEDIPKVEAVLRTWGFRKKGMYWENPVYAKSVQIVGRFDSGSRQRNVVVSTKYGPIRLASMEDIIWKRTYEARGWNRPEALDEAALLVRRFSDRLDWEYISRKAKENGVDDLVSDLRRTRGVLDTPDG